MENAGIVRRIDDLGRIVVPKEIRRSLRIREGDPIEIFASSDGKILLKKYSPAGGFCEFADSLARSLSQVVEGLVCVADRERIIAAAGAGRKEVEGQHISEEVENLMERRTTYVTSSEGRNLPLTDKNWLNKGGGAVLSSIVCNGDCHGAVILFPKAEDKETLSCMKILAKAAAEFISNNL